MLGSGGAQRRYLVAGAMAEPRLPPSPATVTTARRCARPIIRLLVDNQYRVQVQRARLELLGSEPTARVLLDHDGRTILLPKHEALRPGVGFLRVKNALVT